MGKTGGEVTRKVGLKYHLLPHPIVSVVRKLRSDELGRLSPEALRTLPRHPLVVVLDNIRSAYNVGSIFRTADAARAEHIYLTGYTPTPEHRRVAKTALGAEETVPWSHREDAGTLLLELQATGHTCAALVQAHGSHHLRTLDAGHFPLALVLGNEVTGVQQTILDRCDLALEIPQYGAKHSLNVSVAFGVAAFGIVERWQTVG